LLVNKGLAGVFGMEATAKLLGAQSGTGAQKGVAVAAGLEPLAEKLIKDLGYENPTVDQVERITSTVAKAMADIVNAVPPPAELQRRSSMRLRPKLRRSLRGWSRGRWRSASGS
jgi:hypothetical protein